MNPKMWTHPATRRNRATLAGDGVLFVGPARGEMAESGEAGDGRMSRAAGDRRGCRGDLRRGRTGQGAARWAQDHRHLGADA